MLRSVSYDDYKKTKGDRSIYELVFLYTTSQKNDLIKHLGLFKSDVKFVSLIENGTSKESMIYNISKPMKMVIEKAVKRGIFSRLDDNNDINKDLFIKMNKNNPYSILLKKGYYIDRSITGFPKYYSID